VAGPPMADLRYEVSFKGVASPTLRAAFVDYELDDASGATTVRCGHEELRGVMARIEELGLDLLDVRLVAEHPEEHRPPSDSPWGG
jgi:hypothetical protein